MVTFMWRDTPLQLWSTHLHCARSPSKVEHLDKIVLLAICIVQRFPCIDAAEVFSDKLCDALLYVVQKIWSPVAQLSSIANSVSLGFYS